MLKATDFIKKCKIPAIWTICYIFVTWAILRILFNFEMFSQMDWIRISHAHLRGIGGLTFCLIIISTIPLYIATTSIVIKTQKPLLAIPVPHFISKIMKKFFPSEMTTDEKTPDKDSESNTPSTPTTPPIEQFPAEMRGAFIRARTHPDRINAPICTVCTTTPNVYPDTPSAPQSFNDDVPIPSDFDFDDAQPAPAAPVFQDINFYNDDNNTNTENNDNTQTNTTNFIQSDTDYDPTEIIEHFAKTNRQFDILPNGIILTNDAAIAVHTDSDFWIMDDPIWFASGKTRESPLNDLRNIATERGLRAVFYLGADNIMNAPAKIHEWEQNGIHVVKKLSDL